MPHSSLRPSQRLAPRCGQYWSMTPTTPRLSRKASNSSPITTIFFGSQSGSGSSSDSSTGNQNRRSNSPIGVPAPLSVRNLLSSARSMDVLQDYWFCLSLAQARRDVNAPLVSHRPLALHRHAGAGAGVRPVIPHRAVLGAAVVPEGDRVFAPAEAALEQWIFRVLVEIGENSIALVLGDADDVTRKAAVDIERLLARHRMDADHRMLGARIGGLIGDAVIGVEPAVDGFAVVQRGEPVEISLHPV